MPLIGGGERCPPPVDCLTGQLCLAFIIPTMSAGGAERVAATLCNQWSELGHDVHLITFEPKDASSQYPLGPNIKLHRLNLLRASRSAVHFIYFNLKRVFLLRRRLRVIAPDAVVSFMPETNVISIVASLGQRWPAIVSERIHPAHLPLSHVASLLRRLMYPRAAAVVAQTRGIADYIDGTFKVVSTVIPNPVDLTRFSATARKGSLPGRRRIMSVGRMEAQKAFDTLVSAFALVSNTFRDWDLIILGDGSQRSALVEQIKTCDLQGRVSMPGVVSNIAKEFQQTDIYVHSARFEGTPNAVIEALACGCPVIATDCPGGIRDVLGNGAFGRLVPVDDVSGLAQTLSALMADEGAREVLSRHAPDAVTSLSAPTIAARWIDLIRKVRTRMQ